MNNSFKVLQKVKTEIFPLSSYYSYRNPEKVEKTFYNEAKNNTLDEDVLDEIFNDVSKGFFYSKLDEVKRILCIINKDQQFPEEKECGYLNCYLKTCLKISNNFLSIREGKIYINSESTGKFSNHVVGDSYNIKFEWLMIKQLIDQDILIGSYLVDRNVDEKVALNIWQSPFFTTNTILDKKLQKGLSETHMHLGAAKRFASIWISLMNINKSNKKIKKIKDITYGNDIACDIEVCRIVRIFLAYYIHYQNENDFNGFFNKYLSGFFTKENLAEGLKKNEIKILKSIFEYFGLWNSKKSVLTELEKIDISTLFNKVRESLDLYYYDTSKCEIENNYKFYLNNSILQEDLLTNIFNSYYTFNEENSCIEHKFKNIVLPESIFIYKSLNYLKTNPKDEFYSRLFWQYIKLKNIVYINVNQGLDNGKGLESFVKKFHTQSKVTIKGYYAEAFYSQIKDQNIKKLEFRISPSSEIDKMISQLRSIFEVYLLLIKNKFIFDNKYKTITLIGIVYHFIKSSDKDITNNCIRLNDDSNSNKRNGRLIDKYSKEATNIAKLRRAIPQLQYYIVGIDAASKELEIEPYNFKSAYETCRNSNENLQVESEVGFTYHVGEDYRDIISGLRAVDEVIEVLSFKAGDRIGHGIVLGIDIDKWVELNPIVYLNAEEYLDNLLWEWGIYTTSREFSDVENVSYIENEIYYVVEYIFGFSNGLRIRDLYEAYQMKINNVDLRCGECNIMDFTEEKYKLHSKQSVYTDKSWNAKSIITAYNCNYFIKELDKVVTVNIDNKIKKKYKILQEFMRKKVSNKQVIVELNPSSNLSIGEFTSFEDYHIFNMSSPKDEAMIVTLNTDDPVVFNTNLTNEFALLYDITMKKGDYSSKEVIEWLDRLRENGIEYSFIKNRRLKLEELEEEINEILEALKNYTLI